jgi:hypothetical protein
MVKKLPSINSKAAFRVSYNPAILSHFKPPNLTTYFLTIHFHIGQYLEGIN